MPKIKSSLKTIMEKARRIEVLVMDVDGVLTSGHIVLDTKGKELKFFDVKDGFGLMLLKKAGLKSAIITAGNTSAVAERARQLKIDLLFQGAIDKLSAYRKIKNRLKVSDSQVCFIGDELIDLPILKKVGLACTVPEGSEEIMPYVDYVSFKKGGRGAVREIAELILKSKGLWRYVTESFFKG